MNAPELKIGMFGGFTMVCRSGSIKNISYPIKGFKEPLIRKIDVSEIREYDKFIKNLNKFPEKKEELKELYSLTEYRAYRICAINNETIEKIKNDLDKEGLLYNE